MECARHWRTVSDRLRESLSIRCNECPAADVATTFVVAATVVAAAFVVATAATAFVVATAAAASIVATATAAERGRCVPRGRRGVLAQHALLQSDLHYGAVRRKSSGWFPVRL